MRKLTAKEIAYEVVYWEMPLTGTARQQRRIKRWINWFNDHVLLSND